MWATWKFRIYFWLSPCVWCLVRIVSVVFRATSESTLVLADQKIKRNIREIDYLKTTDGDFYAEVVNAKKQMIFKGVTLVHCTKIISIHKNQFTTNIVKILNMRLIENNEEDKLIIKDLQILDKKNLAIRS